MNAANIYKSDRLKRVLAVLKDRKWHSTWEIMQTAKACAISSCIAELRENGREITCRRRGSKDTTVYEYRLT